MTAQLLKFPARQELPQYAAPPQRLAPSGRLLPVLVMTCLFVNWALVTLGIIFVARGFR